MNLESNIDRDCLDYQGNLGRELPCWREEAISQKAGRVTFNIQSLPLYQANFMLITLYRIIIPIGCEEGVANFL